MKKFFAIYRTPTSVIAKWMETPEAERKTMEAKMKTEWDAWQAAHALMVKETGGLGKTKHIALSGVSDTHNDLMMYSIVEAESPEEAAKIFEGHPHLQIPESTIEVMEANNLPGMQ